MTPAPTPQPPDHGAAGFCTDHAQAPDERRAPVQSEHAHEWLGMFIPQKPPGTIAWWEFEEAMKDYASRGWNQPAERLAQRGGFSYGELMDHLGHEPTTWQEAER